MERDSMKSRKNWETAQELIGDYLTGKREGGDKIEVAIRVAGIHKGMVAAESHMETNRLILGKTIYSKPDELKKYMAASMPQMMIEKK